MLLNHFSEGANIFYMDAVYAKIIDNINELDNYKNSWHKLTHQTHKNYATYEDYCEMVSDSSTESMCLVLVYNHEEIVSIAPFIIRKTRKTYSLGERRLFSLPVKVLKLFGENIIGEISEQSIGKIFEALNDINSFDYIPLGEVKVKGGLLTVLKRSLEKSNWRIVEASHKVSLHWIIEFPVTIDEYFAEFSGKTRSTLRRKVRQFESKFGNKFEVISSEEQVGEFLEFGEQISRLTYQWNVGQRLCNDAATKASFENYAKEGKLRCYLLYASGEPCAFIRGTIIDDVYHYDTPGFDPKFNKYSPGTVSLIKVLEDLIENTDCKVFDFGIGGDAVGYKKIFGNKSYETMAFEVGKKSKLYTILLFTLQKMLFGLKNTGNKILSENLKRSIKQRIRKYGS